MPPEVTFKKAEEKDIPLIMELAHRIWRSHYPSIITVEQIEYMLGNWYSATSLLEQMRDGQMTTLVAVNDIAVGYISIKEKEPGHFFLAKFYIDTAAHRKGIGSATFQYALNTVLKNYKTITLQVNRQNIKAINFYFKHGFVIDKVYDFDIGNGFMMDDFMMLLRAR